MPKVSVFPFYINFKCPTGNQSLDMSCWPGLGQCRQQLDFTVVALHQHLDNYSGNCTIAVELKDRVSPTTSQSDRDQVAVTASPILPSKYSC